MPLKWRCVNVFGHNSFMLSMLKNNMMLPLYLKKKLQDKWIVSRLWDKEGQNK